MPITKASGDMYDKEWVQFCWSPLVGGCQHQCSYCYAAKNQIRFGQWWADCPHWASENFKKVHPITRPEELTWKGFPKLPIGRIFVCHTTDLFAKNVPADWIAKILEHCYDHCWDANGYLTHTHHFVFQTKNTERLFDFEHLFKKFPSNAFYGPPRLAFGTTIETNRDMSDISKAPSAIERAVYLHDFTYKIYKSFVTIEPIMDFDLPEMVSLIKQSGANLVWIGADSKNSRLPEPSKEKTLELITELQKITEVRLKPNLKRIVGNTTLHDWFRVIEKM